MTLETYKTAKFAIDGISDMDDLLNSLNKCADISFNIIEEDDTLQEIHVSQEAQELFKAVIEEVALQYKARLGSTFKNL